MVTSELFYDKDGNMYFAGVDSSAWCLYRMNLKTQEISEVFKLDNKSTRNYTKLAGYDGQYFYVFDKPDLSKGIKNITTDDKNIVYILDTNGEIKDLKKKIAALESGKAESENPEAGRR